MYSLQKPILQNPFHPLDLSPQDLLRIYNRFQQSRQINKNPQQQLSIDTISQLIASLKGIKPSYIQKCITQSFIKPTISWNDFLTLLDQQSQIRQKILDWVLFYDQGYIMRYKLKQYMPFRSKIQKGFDFVTFMKVITIGQEKFCITQIDHQKLILIDVTQGGFKEIHRFMKNNSKMNLQLQYRNNLNNGTKNNSKLDDKSKLFQAFTHNKKIGLNNSLKFQSQKLIAHNSFQTSGGNLRSSELGVTSQDQQTYYKKQRKNIHSVFNIFKDLNIQDSIGLANITANKICDRTFNTGCANTIKDNYQDRMIYKPEKFKQVGSKNIVPFQRAQKKLKSLYEQKSKLSYNPYRLKKAYGLAADDNNIHIASLLNNQKKITHERKQKSYILESIIVSYCQEIQCLCIAYHNMQILILKVCKDLNKTQFQQQDLIKINIQTDHKKNQVIQSVKFYRHTIRSRWFMLVLIRVQYKSEGKNGAAQSYVLGYQIQQIQNKRKGGFNYKYKCNTQQSSQIKKQTFRLTIDKFQATILEVQPKFGLHLLSFNGKYFTFRQDYIESQINSTFDQYWKLNNEERFKNSNLSLSCISIGKQMSNKILFGTNNGNIILYDSFSHQFRIKKVSSRSIVKVQIVQNQGFILTHDQKIMIFNLIKFQQLSNFSTVNQDKLHEKVLNFQYQQTTKKIWTFGSQIKIYDYETDQNKLHKIRQMQKTYTWRLTKLKNQTLPSNSQLKERIETKLSTQHHIQIKNEPELKSSQLMISSQKYFILLSEILEVIVIQKIYMKVKFSFILNVPYDSKVMKIAINLTQKLFAVLLFNQSIYIYNIYTQELYTYIKPSTAQKFVSIAFLDTKNQYLLASGTQSGKIALIPYSTVPQKPIFFLKYHNNPVNIVQMKNNYLISCCEGGKIGIWQLPFNVIKHQFKLQKNQKFIAKIIGFYSNKMIYLKSIDDQLFQINLVNYKMGKSCLVNQTLSTQKANIMSVDPISNQLFLVSNGKFIIFTKNTQNNQWSSKNKIKIIDDKTTSNKKTDQVLSQYGQPLQIGIIGSEKAVIFYEGGGAITYTYQTNKISKYITFNQ